MARQAHRLSDYLGQDHDQAVVKARLSRLNGHAPGTGLREVARLIGPAWGDLRGNGERLYAEQPREFSKRLEDRWRAWRERRAW